MREMDRQSAAEGRVREMEHEGEIEGRRQEAARSMSDAKLASDRERQEAKTEADGGGDLRDLVQQLMAGMQQLAASQQRLEQAIAGGQEAQT